MRSCCAGIGRRCTSTAPVAPAIRSSSPAETAAGCTWRHPWQRCWRHAGTSSWASTPRPYLESFTTTTATLQAAEEPADSRVLADYAQRGSNKKPILIGVSEGAGLSVLAATDPDTKQAVAGVIGLGLPNLNELGWRWRDALIYVTHGSPKKTMFSTAALVDRVTPLPLGAIHSTSDEFVPLMEVQGVLEHAGEPKRLWIIKAADHRFSDNLPELNARLQDAVAWVRQHESR